MKAIVKTQENNEFSISSDSLKIIACWFSVFSKNFPGVFQGCSWVLLVCNCFVAPDLETNEQTRKNSTS